MLETLARVGSFLALLYHWPLYNFYYIIFSCMYVLALRIIQAPSIDSIISTNTG